MNKFKATIAIIKKGIFMILSLNNIIIFYVVWTQFINSLQGGVNKK